MTTRKLQTCAHQVIFKKDRRQAKELAEIFVAHVTDKDQNQNHVNSAWHL